MNSATGWGNCMNSAILDGASTPDKGRGGAKGTQQGCYLTVARQHETTNSGLLPFGRTKVVEGPRELNMVAI